MYQCLDLAQSIETANIGKITPAKIISYTEANNQKIE